MPVYYPEFGDFCDVAADILGITPEQIARLPDAEGRATEVMVVEGSKEELIVIHAMSLLDPDLDRALRACARKEHRSVSEIARTALREYVDRAA